MKLKNFALISFLATTALIGCGGGSDTATTTTPPGPATPGAPPVLAPGQRYAFKSDAGITLDQSAPDMTELRELAGSKVGEPRKDPWSLLASETKFESTQTVARLMEGLGGFSDLYAPTTEQVDPNEGTPRIVPAPPGLRLAGIILANGVAALLEINGRLVEIRPGTRLNNGEWVVVSIDNEKAVLRRTTKDLPHEIVVPLASRLDVGGGGGESGGTGGGGGGRRAGGGPGADTRDSGGGGGNATAGE